CASAPGKRTSWAQPAKRPESLLTKEGPGEVRPRSQRLTLPGVVPSWSATSSCDQRWRIRSVESRCLGGTFTVVYISAPLSPAGRSTENRSAYSLKCSSCCLATRQGEQLESFLYDNIPSHRSSNATHARRAPSSNP